MNIGDKIKNAREDMDMSQRDIANMIPMNQSNYSKIERGLQEPNLDQLRAICHILKLDPSYLLGIDEYESLSADDMKLLADAKRFINKHKNQF